LATAIRAAGLELQEIRGMSYNPVTRKAALNNNTSTNYIVHAKKPAAV
jgi:2-polyprenyl-6-hydroxyphenyl methylase/3-demethylubiquinone-9 3-methyltransferase